MLRLRLVREIRQTGTKIFCMYVHNVYSTCSSVRMGIQRERFHCYVDLVVLMSCRIYVETYYMKKIMLLKVQF